MNQEYIKTKLCSWMTTFLEKPTPALGGWAPCPYARKARLDKKIEIIFAEADKLVASATAAIDILKTTEFEVVVVCFDHLLITPEQTAVTVSELNQVLMPANYVILEDHPQNKEYVAGVNMNFGVCGLMLIQTLTALNTASAKLKNTGYYDAWSASELEYVVNWRTDEVLSN